MLPDAVDNSVIEVEHTPPWAPENQDQGEPRWRTVDRALRDISVRRAALDADEARWLREAEALQIWRPLGMVSAVDYLERVLGYAPRAHPLPRLKMDMNRKNNKKGLTIAICFPTGRRFSALRHCSIT